MTDCGDDSRASAFFSISELSNTDHQQVQSVTGQPAPVFNHDTVRPFLGSPMQECPKTMMLKSAATVIKTVMAMVRKRMNLMNTMTMVTVIVCMTAKVINNTLSERL